MSPEERRELKELILRGEALQQHTRFSGMMGTYFLKQIAEQWLMDADDFVRRSLPWFHDRYLSDLGLEVTLPFGLYLLQEQEELYVRVNKRPARLQEMAE